MGTLSGLLVVPTNTVRGDIEEQQELADVIGKNIIPAPAGEYPPSEQFDRFQVTPQQAKEKANGVLDKGQYGSYLDANTANQVTKKIVTTNSVRYESYWVVDLKVAPNQMNTFRQQGATIPGYILVSATNKDANPIPVYDYPMRYVHLAGSVWFRNRDMLEFDVARRIYYDFELPNGSRVDANDLQGMEIDDSGHPYYTAGIIKRIADGAGDVRDGIVVFDPVTGKVQPYPEGKFPDWLDSSITLDEVASQFANYGAFFDSKSYYTYSEGKTKVIDYKAPVVTPNGLMYQITMKASSGSTNISELYLYDPRTKKSTLYAMTDEEKNIIHKDVRTLQGFLTNKVNNPRGAVPEECELLYAEGRMALYCIITFNDGSFQGFGYVPTNATAAEMAAWGSDDQLAYDAYKRLPAGGVQASTNKEVDLIQFQGSVNRIRLRVDGGLHEYLQFSLVGKNLTSGEPTGDLTPDFIITPEMLSIRYELALLQSGDQVTVTVEAAATNQHYKVTDISVDKTVQPTPTLQGR